MPLVACPNCQNRLKVPDAGPRRQVRCPACQTVFLSSAAERLDRDTGPSRRAPIDVPREAGEPDDEGWEVVEEEDEAAPRRRHRPAEPDDNDDRPATGSGRLGLWLAVGAVVLVALAAVIAVGVWALR